MTIQFKEVQGSGQRQDTLDGSISYTYEYIAYDDAQAQITAADIVGSGLLPSLGDRVENTNAIHDQRMLTPRDNQNRTWTVSLRYNTQETNTDSNSNQEDPRRS